MRSRDDAHGVLEHVFDGKLTGVALQSSEPGAVVADDKSNFDFADAGTVGGDLFNGFFWRDVCCCGVAARGCKRRRDACSWRVTQDSRCRRFFVRLCAAGGPGRHLTETEKIATG